MLNPEGIGQVFVKPRLSAARVIEIVAAFVRDHMDSAVAEVKSIEYSCNWPNSERTWKLTVVLDDEGEVQECAFLVNDSDDACTVFGHL